MFSSLGPTELIIILAIVGIVIAQRKLPTFGRSLGMAIAKFRKAARVPAIATGVPEIYDAVPDCRYAQGFRIGAVAELFGLGPYGLRWTQALVIVLGTLLTSMFEIFATGSPPSAMVLTWLSLSAVVFVFSAITAARSFQSGSAVALFTGAMYLLLYTSLRIVALRPSSFGPEEIGNWIRWGGTSFIWPTLTMFALEFALSGTRRWMRMACALFAASAVETYIGDGMYFGNWGPKSLLEVLVSGRIVTMIITAVIWTLAFWIGQTRFGGK